MDQQPVEKTRHINEIGRHDIARRQHSDQMVPTLADIPGPCDWDRIREFAHTFDGYRTYGERCGEMGNQVWDYFNQHRELPPEISLEELRNALFFYHRSARHGGFDFEEVPSEVLFVNLLVDDIWLKVRALAGMPSLLTTTARNR